MSQEIALQAEKYHANILDVVELEHNDNKETKQTGKLYHWTEKADELDPNNYGPVESYEYRFKNGDYTCVLEFTKMTGENFFRLDRKTLEKGTELVRGIGEAAYVKALQDVLTTISSLDHTFRRICVTNIGTPVEKRARKISIQRILSGVGGWQKETEKKESRFTNFFSKI